MSTPAPSTAPAAPAAPAVTTPSVTPETNAAPPAEGRHPALAGLLESLQRSGDGEKKADKKPDPKPEAKTEPAAAKPAENTPPEEPIKVRKGKAPTRPKIPTAQPAPVAPPAPVAAAPAEDPLKDLQDDERKYLEDLKELERRFPDKHKGKTTAAERFIREHIKKLEAPDFDAEDPSYLQWVAQNKPKLNQSDLLELHSARVEERVSKSADEKLNNIRHENFVKTETPRIKQESHQMVADVASGVLPDDVLTEIRRLQKDHGPQKGIEEARKSYGLEMDVAAQVLEAAKADIEEFSALTTEEPSTRRPIKAYDKNNPQHQRLDKMVENVCEQYKGSNEPQQRDGKWFVTRVEWNTMPAEARHQYWTFDNKEILKQALKSLRPATLNAINQRRAEIEKYNFRRQVVPTTAPVAPTPPSGAPPALRPSPIPSPNANGPTPTVDPRVASLMGNLKRT